MIADTFTMFAVVKWLSFAALRTILCRGSAGNNAFALLAQTNGKPYGSTFFTGLRIYNTAQSTISPSLLTYFRNGAGTDQVRYNRASDNAAITSQAIGTDSG
ncbi:hypothetical protein V4W88_10070, partial [Pediococcus acidilactici]|uniref:hypothetical protein n=1 Tax=Pediococcus acidilactici TaxID=1254 RepID=UPI002FBEA372